MQGREVCNLNVENVRSWKMSLEFLKISRLNILSTVKYKIKQQTCLCLEELTVQAIEVNRLS